MTHLRVHTLYLYIIVLMPYYCHKLLVLLHHIYGIILHNLRTLHNTFTPYVLVYVYTTTQRYHSLYIHLHTTNSNYISSYYTC